MRVRALALVLFVVACEQPATPPEIPIAAGHAPADPNLEALMADDGQDHVGAVLIVTDNRPDVLEYCGISSFLWGSLQIGAGGGASQVDVGITAIFPANPGDRFEVLAQQPCAVGLLELTLRPVPRGTGAIVEGNIPNDSRNHVGTTMVVTDRTPTLVSKCAEIYLVYHDAVALSPGSPVSRMDLALVDTFSGRPGDRFEVLAQDPCGGDRLRLWLEALDPNAP